MAESLLLTDLPINLLTEIVARLPFRTLFAAKCVSTLFDNLISPNNPEFTKLHSAVSSHILVFESDLFLSGIFSSRSRGLYAFDSVLDVGNSLRKNFRSTAFHTPPTSNPMYVLPDSLDEHPFIMVNSCNSLLYFVRRDALDTDSLVCNPVTNEYYMIPAADSTGSKARTVCSWLGFCPATNRYKVLRFCMPEDHVVSSILKAKVIDVGCNSWRDIADTYPRLFHITPWDNPQCFAFLNGVLYWIGGNAWETMYFFDFEKEKFGLIDLPLCFRKDRIRRLDPSSMALGLLRGYLVLTVYLAKKLFLFCKSRNAWKAIVAIDIPRRCPIGSWFKPLSLSKSLMLLLSNGGVILFYDQKNRIARFLGSRRGEFDCDGVVALAPSFVPLKDTLKVDEVILNSSRPAECRDFLGESVFEKSMFEDSSFEELCDKVKSIWREY